MSRFTDPAYLRDEQYRDDANFRARIELHRRFSTNPEPWHRWVFDRLVAPEEARVLDVGCGPGELWRQNLDRIPPGWALTLCDLSPGMIDAARAALGARAEYEVADVQELPFEDDSFDAAIANHMLYHVQERPKALAELRRVLRPGGVLHVSANGLGHLREIKALMVDETPWSLVFRLETGAEELGAFFDGVELELFPGDLEVTEAEPLLAFVRSFEHDEADDLEQRVRGVIECEGAFRVRKSTGLFRAHKP